MRDAISILGAALANTGAPTTIQTETVESINPLTLRGVGGPVTVQHTTGWVTQPGDQVLTIRAGVAVWIIGPVSPSGPPPQSGIVASVSGSLVTVSLPAPWGAVVLPAVATVTASQQVGISWQWDGTQWTGIVLGRILTNPGSATAPPPPSSESDTRDSGATGKPITAKAIATASWRQGWRTDTTNLYQGNAGSWSSYPYPQRGVWFYGAGAFDDGKGLTCTKITVAVRVIPAAGDSDAVPVRFRLHTSATKGSNLPTLLAGEHVVNLAPGTHTVTLPNSMGQSLLDGTAAGIAVVSDATAEYRGIYGLRTDPESGHITITTT